MGKPLFKAPDGGYYEIVRVTEDSIQSELQQGLETSVLVDQKVRPEAFTSGLPMSVWSKIYATAGFIWSVGSVGYLRIAGALNPCHMKESSSYFNLPLILFTYNNWKIA